MSFCSNCGSEMTEGTAFCPNCGAGQVTPAVETEVVNAVPAYQEPVSQQSVEVPAATLTGAAKIMSIISMICGIVSCVTCIYGFAFSIPAFILASIAGKKAPGVPNTMTKVGKITAIIGIVLSVISWIVYIVIIAAGTASSMDSYYYYGY